MSQVHVIPVWDGMTVEDAFDEIEVMGEIVSYRWWWRFTRRCRWATVQVDDNGTKRVL